MALLGVHKGEMSGVSGRPSRARWEAEESKWMSKVRCPSEHVVLFLRQMSIMLQTGVPIVPALETLSHQEEYPNFGEAVVVVAERVGQGHHFSHMLSQFPGLFSGVHIAMVRTGERTGALAESLSRVADWGERDNRLFRDVKSAFTYPCIVLVVAFVLTLILFLTVLPGFVEMFEERGMELPLITKVVVLLTKLAANPGAWMIGCATAVLGFTSAKSYLSTTQGALKAYRGVLLVPIVGDLLETATIARYTNVLGTLLDSGLDLLSSLRLAAQASGSPLLKNDSERLVLDIQHGAGLAESMRAKSEAYPNILIEMARVGEETSSLARMFSQVSAFLDDEVTHRVESLSSALEPIMLVLVSLLVGSILLAIILPLYGFLNQIGL